MDDKFLYGTVALCTGFLAAVGRISFVRRSELFYKGQPIYQLAIECEKTQAKCHKNICSKLEALHENQKDVRVELCKRIDSLEEKTLQTFTSIARIEQMILDQKK